MNNYPYNPYNYSNQGQEYTPYQQPPYEGYGVVPGSAAHQSLLSKEPGDVVPIEVHRVNQQLTVNVELGELQVE
jgi:hypothetical protein